MPLLMYIKTHVIIKYKRVFGTVNHPHHGLTYMPAYTDLAAGGCSFTKAKAEKQKGAQGILERI
jgi:hypothetical protein